MNVKWSMRLALHVASLAGFCLVLAAPPLAQTVQAQSDCIPGTIIYVNDDSPGPARDGSNWTHAYSDLQAALDQANLTPATADQIWVAAGTYSPTRATSSDPRSATFALANCVAIYGGFSGEPGSEGDFSIRDPDPATNNTVLSGLLNNSYTVVTAGSGVNATAVLDGFTVRDGNANGAGWPYQHGGGLHIYYSNPTIANVDIRGNFGLYGGGMYSAYRTPVLTGVTLSENTARFEGGGLYIFYGNPTLDRVSFHGNSAGSRGGGLYIFYGNPTLNNVNFSENSVVLYGGGMYIHVCNPILTHVTFRSNTAYAGGGIYSHLGSPRLTDVTFRNNSVDIYGGGMNASGSPILNGVTFSGNSNYGMYFGGHGTPTVANAVFLENAGAGLRSNSDQSVVLTNSSFVRNSGVGILNSGSDLTIRNSILWNNTGGPISGPATVTYSDIQGGWAGMGNINLDPNFVDAANGDLHLQPGSPAIDAGDSSLVPPDITGDRDGNPRMVGAVDMGAYEFQNQPPAADAGPLPPAERYFVAEGDAVPLDGTQSQDPDDDPLTFVWDLDDDGTFGESGVDALHGDETGATPDFSAAGLDSPATSEVTVYLQVCDPHGACDTAQAVVDITDRTPTAAFSWSPESQDEGSPVTFTDLSTSVIDEIVAWVWDFASLGGSTEPHPGFSFMDDGVYPVCLTVTDDDASTDTRCADVTVLNTAPTVTAVQVPVEPVNINEQTAAQVAVTFDDPAGSLDNDYRCAFDLDNDDVIDVETIASWPEGTGEGTCRASLADENRPGYGTAGVFKVMATVTDKDGATGNLSAVDYVVIYDPEGGFVTGGGWIMSPAGAYPADPALTGKATFGFVSKYKKGAMEPTGETEFQFKAGDLNFHSSSYEWLVIAGANAKYKGEGTINGIGSYKFMLTATDGDLLGGSHVDEFRIKIWDDTGVVYDNKMGVADDVYGGTELGGGSIKIHKGDDKSKASATAAGDQTENMTYLPLVTSP